MFEIGLTYKDIDYLLYTHFHLDHIADLGPIIFASKYDLDPRIKELTVIGPQGIQEFYQKLLDLYGKQIQNLNYNIHIVDLTTKFTAPGWEVSFIKTQHTPESIGYRILERSGNPDCPASAVASAGKHKNDKVIVYSGDTEPFPELSEFAKGADILILECAFPMYMPYHLYPDVVGEIAQASGTKWLIISHLYPLCDEKDILTPIRKKFKGKLTIAHDLMQIEV
ncbi:MAG: MBL fold metallo-hydrolase [Candidatus Stahlbacteria bacterium]|nr:MBL fold metallo-hydrolase [Candidatus Stahlbacteria bacterium]